MKIFFLLSVSFHVIFILTAWFCGVGRKDITRPVKLSLRIAQAYGSVNSSANLVEELERTEKEERLSRSIPLPIAGKTNKLNFENIAPNRQTSYLKLSEEEFAAESAYLTPVNKAVLQGLTEPLDPLSGINIPDKDNAPFEGDGSVSAKNKAENAYPEGNISRLSWLNTGSRAVIFSPEIKLDDFVFDAEDFLDMVVRIQVSPEGNVLDARLLPPGSGDVKLDRYVYSRTLEIVMEPVASSTGIEEAEIHLVFAGRRK